MADELPAFDDLPSFDDLPDAAGAKAPTQQAAVPNFDDIPDFDALPDDTTKRRPAPEGPVASGLREAAHAVIPAIAGTIAGGAAGALATPVAPGLGTIAAGAAGFVGGSMAADAAQEAGLRALGFDDSDQRAANAEANPKSSFVGGLAPAVATMNPVAAGETIAKRAVQRGVGAAAMGGFEAGGEAVQGEHLSPEKIAIAAATGAVFPSVNRVGEKLMHTGERMIPGRPNRSANPAAAQAHEDVGDDTVHDAATTGFEDDNSQPTTGNPQSAPDRSARDYGKDKAPVTPENDMLSQGDIAPDTAAALAAAEPAKPTPKQVAGTDAPIPGFDDHPSGVGQQAAPQAPPVQSDAGLLDASQTQRQAEGAVREKMQGQQLDQEPPAPNLDVYRAAAPVTASAFDPQEHYNRTNAPENPNSKDLVDPDTIAAAEENAARRDNELGPPKAAAAINKSKSKLGMPKPSVEAGFPQPGEPVAMGANDVPKPKPMPELKGEAPINDSVSQGQKEAGNYPKARANDFGKPQAFETHAGDMRKGVGPDGTPWEAKLPYDYGYFNKTKGADGDHIDVARPAAGDPALGDKHFIIDQKNADTGKFDEHKVFTYYKDEAAAREHYNRGFSDGKGPDRLGAITEVSRPDLVKFLARATTKAINKPFAMKESKAAKPAAERAVIKDLIEKKRAAGDEAAAAAIENAPEEKLLAAAAGKRLRKYGVGTGKSAGYPVEGITNAEGQPVTANTKIKAQERSAKHKEVQNWFAESAPKKAEETNGELLDRIKPGPGRGDLSGWTPSHKPAEWMWAREADRLLKKPTPGAISKFREAERLLRGGKEDVDNYRGGNRVEADIARSKRSGDDAVANAEAANVDLGRNSVEDEMLARIDAKNGGKFDVPHEEAESMVKPTPVRTAADMKELPRRTLDLTPEAQARKAEAAELAGRKPKEANVASEEKAASAPKVTKGIEIDAGERARIMEALNAATKKSASRDPKLDITAPEDTGPARGRGDLTDMVRKFAADEGGSLDIQKLKADLKAAANLGYKSPVKTYRAKEMTSAHDEYIQSLSDALHRTNQEDRAHAVGVQQAMEAMPKELDAAMRERIYHARDADSAHVDLPGKQAGKTNIESLPANEKALYDQHLKPILDENDQFVKNIRALDAKRMGPDVEHHISRIVKGETDKYNVLSKDDPFAPPQYNGMSVNADAAKDRQFYALENAKTGKRTVISARDNGFTAWDKFKRKQFKDPTFEFEDGKTHKVGGQDYTMRQATTKEIEANARGLDGGKKPMQYYKDAGMAATLPNLQLGSMARHLAELERIRQTPEFGKLTTSNPEKAKELGWKPTRLPNFPDTLFMHPDLKAVFDDYAGHPSNSLRDLNNWVTKALFWMPTAHIANVGTHWFVGRGWDNVTPKGVMSLIKTAPKAFMSVVNQDHYQQKLRNAGAGTVYGGVITRDMAEQIGKAFQQDVKKNPAKWDIPARTLGVGVEDLGNAVYRWSSKTMWAANDMFLTQRIMELERKGMSLKEAINDAERDIPNYRVPIKVIGSGAKGRMLSEAMQDPIKMSFGRYHYGMMNSYANIVKGALGKDSTAADRLEAVGKMMALGLLTTVMYPAMDKLAKMVTGNEGAEQQRRGPSTIPHHIWQALHGKEDFASALRSTLTLPPLTTTALETLYNKDFRGKAIVEPGTMERVGKGSAQAAGKAVVQEGEHLVRGLVSPVNTLETAMKKEPNQSKAAGVAHALGDQVADVKEPSKKAQDWDRMSGLKNLRGERTRDKAGGSGVLEGLYNKATKN